MGNIVSSASLGTWFGGRQLPPLKLIITGLDAAGKTTILYHLKLGKELQTTIPTIGFNVETLNTGTETIIAWDVGGRSKIRALWRHYYPGTDALVFVVDSNDPDRMDQAKDELFLHHLNEEELSGVPLLVFCNKQDLPNALPPQEVANRLGLTGTGASFLGRPFLVMGCVGTSGDGLKEGMAWVNRVGRTAKYPLDKKELSETTPTTGKPADSLPKKKQLAEKLGFDPSDAKTNPVLQSFRPIQLGTECPFAMAAKLWGVSVGNGNNVVNAEALAEFVRQSSSDEKALDGFCIELPPEAAQASNPSEFGAHVKETLRALSDLDPSGERAMRVKYIGARGWRFRFAKADFFVTTFAPCYPPSSSRYAFGAGKAFVLLQPELSFLRHHLPDDTPVTEDPPKTVRDKTRLAFRSAGRGYSIPKTTKYPPAEHIVKPLYDDGFAIVRWWVDNEAINEETKTAN